MTQLAEILSDCLNSSTNFGTRKVQNTDSDIFEPFAPRLVHYLMCDRFFRGLKPAGQQQSGTMFSTLIPQHHDLFLTNSRRNETIENRNTWFRWRSRARSGGPFGSVCCRENRQL